MITLVRGPDRFRVTTLSWEAARVYAQQVAMGRGWRGPKPLRSWSATFDAVPSRCKQVLRYDGDRGVALQHVGVLVGQTAHHRVWPKILRWIDKCPFKS